MLSSAGCARWATTPQTASKSNRLAPARLAADAVVLDVAYLRLPAADLAGYDEIWTAVDEQPLPVELRRDLGTNGLRAGIIGQELPARLRERLDAKENDWEVRSEDVARSDVGIGGGKWHLQVRTGRRRKILASKTYPTLSVLLCEDGQVRGHQLREAQCLLSLRTYPQGDGRVKLELTPEIEHGDVRNEWGSSEGTWVQRVGRERLVVERLRLEAWLAPGQSLLVSTTRESKGLGDYFFAETAGETVARTALLIRLAQTQLDDLFAPEQISTPLATPGE